MRKLLGKVNACNLADKYLCTFGNLNAGKCCNGNRSLSNYFCIERAVNNNGLSDLLGFGFIEEVATTCGKFSFYFIVYLFINNNRLLGSANHTVVKSL